MIIIVLIISFILDSLISNYIPLNSLLSPLLTIMALIIIYPYCNGDKKKYYLACFITGVFYDLIYTNTIVIHGFLFVMIAFIITKLNLILSNNYLNVMIMAVVCIIAYRTSCYILLLMTNNVDGNLLSLIKSIYSSLILNLIYVALAYIITDKISYKLKIHKSN